MLVFFPLNYENSLCIVIHRKSMLSPINFRLSCDVFNACVFII